MSVSIEIDCRETTPTGITERGIITFGSQSVTFVDRRPNNLVADEPFILETGLAAGVESLTCAGRTISELGHRAISVKHTHHDMKHPIRHNAEDIEAVIEGLTGDLRVHSTGLSRGWPAQVLATKHMPEKVASLTAIAPAMMAPVNPFRVIMLGGEMVMETAKSPREFGRVILDSINTVRERPDVTMAEAFRLLFGRVHKRVLDLRESQGDVDLHLVSSARDCFFDDARMEAIARLLGFDTYKSHSEGTAGHAAFAYSPELVESIVNTAITFDKKSKAA
jgi:pimeloyl-ACP methyl ester carboxylesterase